MSFSAIGADPAWGTAMTVPVGYPYGFTSDAIGIDALGMVQVNLGPVLECAAINRSGLELPAAGWQMEFTDTGGGGPSNRPTSGLVYPRFV